MAASSRIVEPVDAKKRWVFKTPQNDQQDGARHRGRHAEGGPRRSAHRLRRRLRRGWWNDQQVAETRGIKVVGSERYDRADSSVTGQILKLSGRGKPDAILIAGLRYAGRVCAAEDAEGARHTGKIYQTHGCREQ